MNKGQAALFDGIMFLLFVSGSMAMVIVFANDYGKGQEEALNNAYILAYMQDATKALFYVNAVTVKNATSSQIPFLKGEKQNIPGYTTLDCSQLNEFDSSTIAELVKKDLSDTRNDATALADVTSTCLDDHYGIAAIGRECVNPGTTTINPKIPGKTALRCAMKELMKPFHYAGFKYFTDIVQSGKVATNWIAITGEEGNPYSGAYSYRTDGSIVPARQSGSPSSGRITNANVPTLVGSTPAVLKWYDCVDVAHDVTNILTIGVPFRVQPGVSMDNDERRELEMKTCLWTEKTG